MGKGHRPATVPLAAAHHMSEARPGSGHVLVLEHGGVLKHGPDYLLAVGRLANQPAQPRRRQPFFLGSMRVERTCLLVSRQCAQRRGRGGRLRYLLGSEPFAPVPHGRLAGISGEHSLRSELGLVVTPALLVIVRHSPDLLLTHLVQHALALEGRVGRLKIGAPRGSASALRFLDTSGFSLLLLSSGTGGANPNARIFLRWFCPSCMICGCQLDFP